jgi:hypothetical protein
MVQIKKKVTLKKKVETPSASRKTWIWLLCSLLVVVVIAVFLYPRVDKETPDVTTNEVDTPSVLTSDNITESIDSTKQDEIVIEETVVETTKVEPTQVQDVTSSINITVENVEQKAWAVIRGNYDNNPIRRQKLGEDYQVIQDKVNELYRKGLVH